MTIKKFFGSTGVGQFLGGLAGSVPILGGAVQQALSGANADKTSTVQKQATSIAALPASPAAPPPAATSSARKTYFLLGGTTYKRVWMIALASAAVIAFGPGLIGKLRRA